jgi:RNA polymerase sigma-70 factor, ECF subfamily
MDSSSASGITLLLRAWSEGDAEALQRLTPLVYQELHRTARRYMAREKAGHILQSTALVNETYLQLAKLGGMNFQDRAHFFAICARLMRRILTDHARSHLSLKAGGGALHVPLDEAAAGSLDPKLDLLALDDALNHLAAIDERQSQVVQMRFFLGLSVKETADILNVSERTVKADWTHAKLWLLRELDKRKAE